MDKEAAKPPVPLGRKIFEGCTVSSRSPKISYSVHQRVDPSTGTPEDFEIHVADIEIASSTANFVNDSVVYRTRNGRCPEPQDFRRNDTEVTLLST